MSTIFEFSATFCAGIFAGAATYVTLVEHPARMECGTALAVAEFGPSYRRATVLQALLAILAFVASVTEWWLGAGVWWLVGAVVILAVIPFTLIVILPTNKKLLDPSLNRSSEAAHQLLIRWGKLHAVRTILSLAAFVVFLLATALADR